MACSAHPGFTTSSPGSIPASRCSPAPPLKPGTSSLWNHRPAISRAPPWRWMRSSNEATEPSPWRHHGTRARAPLSSSWTLWSGSIGSRRIFPRSGTAYPALVWRLQQPCQGYRCSGARRILARSPSPLCRRGIRLCPRNPAQLGTLIKEDLRSRPSVVRVRRRDEDRFHHYATAHRGPHPAPSLQQSLPGAGSL